MTLKPLAAAGLAMMLAQTAQAGSLSVVITGIEEQKGEIRVALYDSSESFDQGGPAFWGGLQPVTGQQETIIIDDLESGRYAIKLFHDADSDGEMDANMMGMPAERYGFSGKSDRRGPPLWQDAVFDVVEGDNNLAIVELR